MAAQLKFVTKNGLDANNQTIENVDAIDLTLGPTSAADVAGRVTWNSGNIDVGISTGVVKQIAYTDALHSHTNKATLDKITEAADLPLWNGAAWPGGSGGSGTRSVTEFTASAAQTVFNVTYPVGSINVYVNGVLLGTVDYTATNGTSVTIPSVATGDHVVVEAFTGDIETLVYPVTSVAGKTGAVTLTKADVGLSNVDNTADASKSVASAATLATPRTVTIGATGKAFDGSGAVSWTMQELATGTADATTFLRGDQTWQPLSSSTASTIFNVTTTSTSKTAAVDEYVTVLVAALTITLPASPAVGDTVKIGVLNFTNTIVARNSQNIMGLAENMTINVANVTLTFTFVDATRGWRVS